jgi:hypothetical protein
VVSLKVFWVIKFIGFKRGLVIATLKSTTLVGLT